MKMTGSIPESLGPQFNARHPAEMDIQEETIDLSGCSAIEEFLRRCKDHGRKALCVQQALGGVEHAGIVIYDGHDLPTLRHETSRLPSDRETKPGADFDRTPTYDRTDVRRDLSLGEVLDTALSACSWLHLLKSWSLRETRGGSFHRARPLRNAIDANSIACARTRSLSPCEPQAAPPVRRLSLPPGHAD